MSINKDELTKEMIEKAMQCKTAEELIALAKTGGYELTQEEAESYLAELADIELDGEVLYRSMVNRNRRNTRMTGVNALG